MTESEARDFLTAFGGEVAMWRKRRGLTRAQLASRIDISETTLGRIERGDESAAVAAADAWRLARALGLTFTDMVRRSEDAAELSEPERMVAKRSSEAAGASEDD